MKKQVTKIRLQKRLEFYERKCIEDARIRNKVPMTLSSKWCSSRMDKVIQSIEVHVEQRNCDEDIRFVVCDEICKEKHENPSDSDNIVKLVEEEFVKLDPIYGEYLK